MSGCTALDHTEKRSRSLDDDVVARASVTRVRTGPANQHVIAAPPKDSRKGQASITHEYSVNCFDMMVSTKNYSTIGSTP